MGDMMSNTIGFGLLGLLMMTSVLLFVVGIVLLLVWLVRRVDSGAGSSATSANANPGQEKPLTILQGRYARGEIGSEEYQRIRSDLLRDGGGQ